MLAASADWYGAVPELNINRNTWRGVRCNMTVTINVIC